jgi:hypothetical protein
MGGRIEVGFEGGPSGGIDVNRAGSEERLQIAGQVARRAIVGRDDNDRPRVGALRVDQGGEQVGAKRGGDVGLNRLAVRAGQRIAEGAKALAVGGDLE